MPTTNMLPVIEYIAANELSWWHNKLKQSEVRKLILENTGLRIGRKKGEFKEFCAANMKIYMNRSWRRKPKSTARIFTNDQWDQLREVVEKLKPQIEGQGIAIAFDIIRTKISTNVLQLRGLPKRLHYWNK